MLSLSFRVRSVLAATSGALVVLAFPSYGGELGLELLVLVSLVPLLAAAAGVGASRGLLLGCATGTVLEGAGFIWILYSIRSFTALPSVPASAAFLPWLIFSVVPWALLGGFLGLARKPADILWAVPFWVGLEEVYPRLFPWTLGGAFYSRPLLVQCADLLGAGGLSFLILLANAAAFLVIEGLVARRRLAWKAPLATLALLAAALLYGRARLAEIEALEREAPRRTVALVQGFRDPLDRRDDERLQAELSYYLARTAEIEARAPGSPLDLVVWPEGADPYPFNISRGEDPWSGHEDPPVAAGRATFRKVRVPLLLGSSAMDRNRAPPWSNAAVYLRPGEPPLYYEKNHRLFLGEWNPLVDWLPRPWSVALELNVGTIAAGASNSPFDLGGLSFRCLICYEAVLAGYVRETARGVSFLVNITEDRWYGQTAHIPQHVSVIVMRAVENRISIARAANVGPSGVFLPSGRRDLGAVTYGPETVLKEVPAVRCETLYAAGGHLFAPACLLVGLLAALRTARRRPGAQQRGV